jgi:hypothetical protein
VYILRFIIHCLRSSSYLLQHHRHRWSYPALPTLHLRISIPHPAQLQYRRWWQEDLHKAHHQRNSLPSPQTTEAVRAANAAVVRKEGWMELYDRKWDKFRERVW